MCAARIANMKHGGSRKARDKNQSANWRLDRPKIALTVAAEQLSVSERSVVTAPPMCAARVANMKPGRPEKQANLPIFRPEIALSLAAQQFSVSVRSINMAEEDE